MEKVIGGGTNQNTCGIRPVIILKEKLLTNANKEKDEYGNDCWKILSE